MNTAFCTVRVGLKRFCNRSNLSAHAITAFGVALGLCLCVAPACAQTAASAGSHTFPMKFVEKSGTLSLDIEPGKGEVKFRKEPDFGKDKVVRHAIAIGPGKDDFLGFALDFTKKTLYFDLNQNLDLTDDPQGVFQAGNQNVPTSYAMFRSVRINFKKNGVERTALFEPFYYYGDNSGYAYLQSSYQAEIELAGQKWRLEVIDDLNGVISDQDRFMIVPISDGSGAKQPVFNAMKVPGNLFLGGRLYQLKFTFGTTPEAAPLTADFTEIGAPMGELAFDGQFVRRAVLEGNGLAVFDGPGETVAVPAGKYKVQTIYLQAASGSPMLATSKVDGLPQITVAAGTPAHVKIGAPLESSVQPSSRGNVLTLNYILKGSGGEEYSAVNPDSKNPPKLTIYKGDRQVGAGNFSFG